MKIQVRPLKLKSWHNKTGEESFKRPIAIRALVDADSMTYMTGLNDSEPYDVEDNVEGLTEKAYYERKLNVDLSNIFTPGKSHPIWDGIEGNVKLENRTMVFDDLKRPWDHIKIRIMQHSKYVANSMEDYTKGLFPYATHVIINEDEETKIKASKIEQKKKAIIECNKLSRERKLQMVILLAGKDLSKNSGEFLEVAVDNLIDSSPSKVLEFINGDKRKQQIMATVSTAEIKGVVRKIKSQYCYMDIKLGYSLVEAAEYLNKDEHQELLIRIETEIKA